MNDLIERADAIKAMEQRYEDILRTFKRKVKIGEKAIVLDMIGCVKNLPSADRLQGKWIRTAEEYIGDDVSGFYDYHWACSECEKEAIINDWNIYELSDYCPHCGAKMKGTDDE